MTTAIVFNCMDAIRKYGRQKINSIENILGSIQTKNVATVGSTVRVIKDFCNLIMGEAAMQYGTDAPMVQDIPYEEISSSLVSNVSMIFST